MTGIVIDLYRFKVLFAISYLIYLLSKNSDSILTCDLWFFGLFRIIHRLPWLFPNTLTHDNFMKYYVISFPLSMLLHMTLLARENTNPEMCASNQDLEYALYFETYLTMGLFVLFMILGSIFQLQYTITITKRVELKGIPLNKITEWNQTDRMCCICYDDFAYDDIVADIKCRHYDHLHCMNEWVKKSKSCPRCKDVGL